MAVYKSDDRIPQVSRAFRDVEGGVASRIASVLLVSSVESARAKDRPGVITRHLSKNSAARLETSTCFRSRIKPSDGGEHPSLRTLTHRRTLSGDAASARFGFSLASGLLVPLWVMMPR
jgi:hypothetical protein